MRPIWKGALTFGLVTIENVEVPWAEIVKGYESEKGQFVVMTEADVEALRRSGRDGARAAGRREAAAPGKPAARRRAS